MIYDIVKIDRFNIDIYYVYYDNRRKKIRLKIQSMLILCCIIVVGIKIKRFNELLNSQLFMFYSTSIQSI